MLTPSQGLQITRPCGYRDFLGQRSALPVNSMPLNDEPAKWRCSVKTGNFSIAQTQHAWKYKWSKYLPSLPATRCTRAVWVTIWMCFPWQTQTPNPKLPSPSKYSNRFSSNLSHSNTTFQGGLLPSKKTKCQIINNSATNGFYWSPSLRLATNYPSPTTASSHSPKSRREKMYVEGEIVYFTTTSLRQSQLTFE